LAANHFSVELCFVFQVTGEKDSTWLLQYSAVYICIWSLKKLDLEKNDRDEYVRVRKEKQVGNIGGDWGDSILRVSRKKPLNIPA
jgi:hypothetical protein